jgi:hypothetical protein
MHCCEDSYHLGMHRRAEVAFLDFLLESSQEVIIELLMFGQDFKVGLDVTLMSFNFGSELKVCFGPCLLSSQGDFSQLFVRFGLLLNQCLADVLRIVLDFNSLELGGRLGLSEASGGGVSSNDS